MRGLLTLYREDGKLLTTHTNQVTELTIEMFLNHSQMERYCIQAKMKAGRFTENLQLLVLGY